MRTFGAALLLLFLPTLLMAQAHFNSEPFILTSPGVTTRLERFAPLSISENPQLGGIPISRLTVDQRGFLWVATNYGLARFDGHDLKIYREDPQIRPEPSRYNCMPLPLTVMVSCGEEP